MNHLRFTIRNQWITRIDRFKPVAKSRNYLYAKFDFISSEWTGVKTALFNCKGLDRPIGQLIDENGICEVPHEVLDFDSDGDFTVSVFCGDLITVNKAIVHVYETVRASDGKQIALKSFGGFPDMTPVPEPTPEVEEPTE